MSLPTNFFIGRGGSWGYDFPVNRSAYLVSYNSFTHTFGNVSSYLSYYSTNSINSYSLNSEWMNDTKYLFEDPAYEGFVWGVPEDGTYEFSVAGAAGGEIYIGDIAQTRNGGPGAVITGRFTLSKRQQLRIIVGKQGQGQDNNYYAGAGGGGASAVMTYDPTPANRVPLIVAGGGSGAAGSYYSSTTFDGKGANTSTNGVSDFQYAKSGGVSMAGGTSNVSTGYGGYADTQYSQRLGSAGGFYGDGTDSEGNADYGKALNATARGSNQNVSVGGFGGAGAGEPRGGGAGGGYTGGSSISKDSGAGSVGVSVGGSSYFNSSVFSGSNVTASTNPVGGNNYGSHSQSGYVIITRLS